MSLFCFFCRLQKTPDEWKFTRVETREQFALFLKRKTPFLHRRPWTFTVKFHAVVQLHHREHEYRRNDCANLLSLSSALVWLASCRSYNWELSVSASHLKCLCLVSAITQISCCIIHFREIWQHLFKLSIARSWWIPLLVTSASLLTTILTMLASEKKEGEGIVAKTKICVPVGDITEFHSYSYVIYWLKTHAEG